MNTNSLPAGIRLDGEGFPVLDEVVHPMTDGDIPTLEEVLEENSELQRTESLKSQLLEELEPRLREMVQLAFIETVKVVALQMKHDFEQELDAALQTKLADLVDRAVDQAIEARRE